MNITSNGRVFFTEAELRCKGSGKIILAPGFAEALLRLRLGFSRPMVVTSACRSKEHNKRVGGHPRSLHVCDEPYWPTGGCCAVDVATQDANYRAALAYEALKQGWSVGFNKSFLHLDRRTDFGISDSIQMFLY